MSSLLDQITDIHNQLYVVEAQQAGLKAKLRELKLQRAHCQHVFNRSSGTCELCGISKSFANTLQRMIERMHKGN